ncbi:type II secretion system secretin GspD [Rubrivivax albus]|uniref:Type II secretion system protein GspD n=1 Tax=Rubrivivax albus TaxID=2499835 RepID=A0A3S2VYR9_9BURK|nr:type II secretion system secretin GspD [Rubrivivax albus]RVT53395.1 type II secretion system protein GspD [Rubrivivax albus]
MKLRPSLLRPGLFALALATAVPTIAQTPTRAPGETSAARSRAPVAVNFVNADIEAVTRAFAAMIGRQIAVDPRVRGTITVYSEQPISVREAYLTYLSSLRGLGFAMVDNGGLLKVVPEADAKIQTGTVSVGDVGPRGDQVITQIFTLQHQSPNNLVAVLRPLITANNTINANPGSNSLVITDYADNLRRLAQIIAALDRPSDTDVDLIPLKHAVATELAPLVQRLVSSGVVGGNAAARAAAASGAETVVADPRSNSLIVRAPNPTRLAAVRAVIAQLDTPGSAGPAGSIWVVKLKNAEAVRLATVLRAAFSAIGSQGGASGGSGGGLTGSTGTAPTPGGAAGSSGSGASAQATAPVTAAAAPSTGGFIQADPATNSLIISAPEPLYRQIKGMIEQLDERRAQVYIESMIVEVSGDNAADFGFQWQGLLGQSGDSNGLIAGTNFSRTGGNIIDINTAALSGSLTANPLGEGFNIGLIRNFGGTYALAAIARMLQSQTQTNIVSTPNLITLDNEEAKIVVGENVPFITGQFTNTGTATTSPFQTIERKDVGITLRIRPQIGENGTVRMTIYQEQSSVKDTAAVGTSNAGPSTTKRSIESQVVVDDGQIIVLGGLIEDRFIENKSKVPLLGDIPYLGALFRSESREKRRTNLMVFLRPVVMRDQAASDKVSQQRYEELRQRQESSQPLPNPVLPVGEAPVLPPLQAPSAPAAPAPAPAADPATQAGG